jgi:hypothetical protein
MEATLVNRENTPLSLWTNAIQRMTILANGNVGIGTTSPGSTLDVKGTLRLSGSTSGYVGLAPAAAAGSTTYTLPSADGSSGQVLSTNGSGTLSWATPAGGGGAGGAAGPTFHVNKNGTNQTVTTGTWVKLTWSNEVIDSNSNFALNAFTPTVAGYYIFTVNVFCSNATGLCAAGIYKNGAFLVQNNGASYGGAGFGAVTAVIEMNGTTDYVEAYVYIGGGNSVSGTIGTSYFQGSMLAPLAEGIVAGTGTAGKIPVWTSGNALTNAAALDYTGSGSLLTITAQAGTDKPLIVKSAASQSGNLQEWQNSVGTALASITSAGVFSLSLIHM